MILIPKKRRKPSKKRFFKRARNSTHTRPDQACLARAPTTAGASSPRIQRTDSAQSVSSVVSSSSDGSHSADLFGDHDEAQVPLEHLS